SFDSRMIGENAVRSSAAAASSATAISLLHRISSVIASKVSDMASIELDIEQPDELLSGMQVALDHAALRFGSRIGDLQHVQGFHRKAFHQCRIGPVDPREQRR